MVCTLKVHFLVPILFERVLSLGLVRVQPEVLRRQLVCLQHHGHGEPQLVCPLRRLTDVASETLKIVWTQPRHLHQSLFSSRENGVPNVNDSTSTPLTPSSRASFTPPSPFSSASTLSGSLYE